MAATAFTVFMTALLFALIWFLILSVALMLTIKMAGFRKPALFRLTKSFCLRWLVGSFFAAITAVYFFLRDAGSTQEEGWMAVFGALILWSLLLIIMEIFSVKVED